MTDSSAAPGALYRTVLLAFVLVVLGLVFKQLVGLVLLVLIVVIIALPLSWVATQEARLRVPRGLGATVALLLMLGVIGALVALTVPAFSREVNQFTASLPSITDALRHRLGEITGTSPTRVGTQIQQFVDGYTQDPGRLLGPLESVGATVVGAVAALVVILLTALYTAIRPEPLRHGLVRLVPPVRRSEANHVLERLRTAYLGWLRGLAVGILVVGGLTYLALRLVDLQFSEFFSVFTAVAMIVPYFGALISSIPPILFALTVSPGKAIVVTIIYIAAHQIESTLIRPRVVAQSANLHPALIAVGVVAVDQLFGFLGLIITVPILATVKILVEELWVNPLKRREQPLRLDQPALESPADSAVAHAGLESPQETPDARTEVLGQSLT